MMKKYVIQLAGNEVKGNLFEILNTETFEIVGTYTNLEDAKKALIMNERKSWLESHNGMTFIFKFSKNVCYDLHYLGDDRYYLDCTTYDDFGKSVSCTQRYKVDAGLPIDKNYILLSQSDKAGVIVKKITEKQDRYNSWKNLNSMQKECNQLLKEIDMLVDRLEKLR